ncbi:MAG TPA: D-alanyl-D-alanine carboxypeptidase family protein, partial [Bacillota bacterium]|nr:D-alanyl-D-alanine carboxypeptidase family protein [Bacillota bacterium]
VHAEGSSIYLKKGEKMSINDLVYGLMLRSGNDAAIAISEHVGGSVEGFVHLMNEKAQWLGMTDTHFTNPHGLDNENHFSSAYDMAILMRYALENDVFRKITGTRSHKAENQLYTWQNKNKLLTSYYDYCIGGKTGYTRKSGRTLVSAAKKGKMELIAVTLNAGDDWRDHIQLYDWGFNQFSLTKVDTKGKHKYEIEQIAEPITGVTKDNIYLPLKKDEKITKQTKIDERALENNDTIIGKTTYYINDKAEKIIPIYHSPDVQQKDMPFFYLLQESVKHMIGIGFKW